MTAGLPPRGPASENIATPPTVRLHLIADRSEFDLSGKKVWGCSYNGHSIGPTMHFVPGENVGLTMVNRLPTPVPRP